MGPPDAMRRRSFRRCHERQLIEGHAYLVTGLLALIMMAISIETSTPFKHRLTGLGGSSPDVAARISRTDGRHPR